MIKPNYNNSIMSITNSLLKYYGANPYHATLPIVDKLFAKDYKNVVYPKMLFYASTSKLKYQAFTLALPRQQLPLFSRVRPLPSMDGWVGLAISKKLTSVLTCFQTARAEQRTLQVTKIKHINI